MDSDPQTTKQRLICAACESFAEKGFRDATVADICEKAGANIAAVNYHFGDKEKLYEAVWRHAFAIAATAHPIDGKLPPNPSLEDCLFSYANAILHRIFSEDDTGYFAKLLYHEMAAPTLALDLIAEEALQPQKVYLTKVLRGYLGEGFDEEQLKRCKRSIIGQCAFYNFSRPLRERVLGKKRLTEAEIERTARHIARFSLGGLNAVKKEGQR